MEHIPGLENEAERRGANRLNEALNQGGPEALRRAVAANPAGAASMLYSLAGQLPANSNDWDKSIHAVLDGLGPQATAPIPQGMGVLESSYQSRGIDQISDLLVSRLDGSKEAVALAEVASGMTDRLASVQRALFADAVAYREANTHQIGSFDEFAKGVDEAGGFWVGAWCGDDACEAEIAAKTKATIRFLPFEPADPGGPCVHCGKPGTDTATWARAY